MEAAAAAADLVLLPDPCGDRQIKSIAPPPHKALSVETLFKGGRASPAHPPSGKPNWKTLV